MLVVAAGDPRIAAVIAQAPFTDNIPVIRRMSAHADSSECALALPTASARSPDAGRSICRLSVRRVSFAALTEPDAGVRLRVDRDPHALWRNEFAARLILSFAAFRPVRYASALSMPVLFCVCDDDTTTPPASTIRAAGAAPVGSCAGIQAGTVIYNDSPGQGRSGGVPAPRRAGMAHAAPDG